MERNIRSSKDFNEEIIERAIALSVFIGGKKSPPHTKNEI